MLKGLVGLALVALLAIAPAAAAQQYPPSDNSITSPTGTTYNPGDPATFSAKTFQAGSETTFTFFSDPVTLGTVRANSAGVATINTRIPANAAPGRHTVRASGINPQGQPLNVDLAITVRGDGAPLPRTGASNSVDLSRVGIAALAGGGLLVLASKKRRDRMASATIDAS